MNILNMQQQRLQEFQPQYQQQLAATYESQIPQLQQVAESGLAKIGEQETGVKSQRESALSTARRQYEQGLQKGQQLFGGVGGSSAGQAFADIASQGYSDAYEKARQAGLDVNDIAGENFTRGVTAGNYNLIWIRQVLKIKGWHTVQNVNLWIL